MIFWMVCVILKFDFATNNQKHYFLIGIGTVLCMKFISNFLIFIGFWSLAEEDLIGVNPDSNIPDRYLYRAGIVLIVFSGI